MSVIPWNTKLALNYEKYLIMRCSLPGGSLHTKPQAQCEMRLSLSLSLPLSLSLSPPLFLSHFSHFLRAGVLTTRETE